jgi:hypothetical protein
VLLLRPRSGCARCVHGPWLCVRGSSQGWFGLDSSYSLMSREFLARLGARVQVVVGDRSWRVATAGRGDPVQVDRFAVVDLQVEGAPLVRLTLGVLDIPVDVLVGWNDVRGGGLWPILCEVAGRGLPRVLEVAPEESEEGGLRSVGDGGCRV